MVAFMSAVLKSPQTPSINVGRKKASLVERAQVVARDAVDGVVLLLPPERSILAVDQAGEFAVGDDAGGVVAVRNGGAQLSLGKFDLVRAETRLGEHFLE